MKCCRYLYFSLVNNCRLELMSSAIKFSKAIENVLKCCNINFKISLDSERKETYEKIKRVKAYERVIKNIENDSNAVEKGFFIDLDPRSEAMYKSKIYI